MFDRMKENGNSIINLIFQNIYFSFKSEAFYLKIIDSKYLLRMGLMYLLIFIVIVNFKSVFVQVNTDIFRNS